MKKTLNPKIVDARCLNCKHWHMLAMINMETGLCQCRKSALMTNNTSDGKAVARFPMTFQDDCCRQFKELKTKLPALDK